MPISVYIYSIERERFTVSLRKGGHIGLYMGHEDKTLVDKRYLGKDTRQQTTRCR